MCPRENWTAGHKRSTCLEVESKTSWSSLATSGRSLSLTSCRTSATEIADVAGFDDHSNMSLSVGRAGGADGGKANFAAAAVPTDEDVPSNVAHIVVVCWMWNSLDR